MQIDPLPLLPNLSYLTPGVVDPPLNKKAYVDISGFTGKPVKGEGLKRPTRGLADVSVSENHV